MPPHRQPGHRQKGAGTVVVSRGDQVRQGLVVKEWQRTPMQLLQQYCQSKKRINARYVHARAPEGRFRMRCILPDDKSSAKDLAFCPEQDFDTMDDAKHCAALLALRHFEPLRPLERQLPEPYDKLWLSLVKEVAPGGPQAAPAEAKKSGGRGRGKKEKEEKTAKPTTRDAKAATTGDAKAEEKTDMDLWANAPAAEEKEDEKKKDKTRVLPNELTSDRKFASRAEYQQAQLERAQHRNEKQRARENRERANPFKQVFMSASCREMIEDVLKTLGVVNDNSKLSSGTRGEFSSAEVPADHEAFYEKASKQLKSIGFQAKHIQGALQSCRKQADHSDDEFLTIILDWLCLNVPEGELPKGFNPEGTQLDVVITNNAATKVQTSSPLVSVLVQRLMKFGYDRMDAVTIVGEYVAANSDALDVSDESPSDDVVLRVVGSAMRRLLTHLSLEAVAAVETPSEEEIQQMREDEMFALEAIYDDKLQRQVLENGDQILVLQLADEMVQFEMLLPHDSKYPFEFPVFGVTSKDGGKQNQLLIATANAIKNSATTLGDPMIYDLCVSVESTITGKPSKERIVLLKTKTSPVAKDQGSGPPPAPVQSDRANAKVSQNNTTRTRKVQPHTATKRGPSPEQINQLSDKLLQLRQAKNKREEFQQMLRARARLPAAKEKENVLQFMIASQVLLICGQTGCGKTTQIPQFILDDFIDSGRGGECNIICTQPRRIAAIGVATRVAQERCEDIADVVGYQIRMDAKKSSNTRLLFCTTGVLLRRLLTDRSLSGVSHVIVDEVHERNVDTDFLLSILRDLLPSRPDLRVILMSATMNAQLFVDYFSKVTKAPCPVLDIPGFTFPVENHFLEDVLAMTKYQVPKKMLLNKKKNKPHEGEATENETEAADKPPSAMKPEELVQLIDDSRIDYDMCAHVVKHIVDQNADAKPGTGAVLVFLPGTAEIKRLMEMLTSNRELASRVWVLPLHGSLSGADQAQVFRSPPKGKTKIIISTNIAETSITINDITAVVDCGKVKEMVYDAQLRRSQLLDCWASQAACDQRKGRAGRVQAGTCYRLFSRKRFAKMDAQLSAEIHRVSLEQLCLQIKKLELGSIRGFLSKAIEPPKQAAIDAAMQELIAIAAFKPIDEDEHSKKQSSSDAEEVRLTPLGNHLAMLPLDARIGKFLIYGSILRCIDPVATIAACISSKSPFVMSMNDPEVKERQDTLKKELGGGSKSDHLLLARLVIDRFEPLKGQKAKRSFCKEYALSFDTLESIVELKSQYLNQLDAIGFYQRSQHDDLNENASVARIVKAALCAGLYANVIQVMYPEQKYFQSAHGVFTEDHDAKKIRYFVRSNVDPDEKQGSLPPRERVFMHPSSCNFSQTQYDSPWLLYTELVQTSKVFVRESTMIHPYALLLFGGKLDVHHEKNLLCLDGWIRFNAVARIGVLIKAIRRKLDELLTQKIAQPELDIAKSELVTAISFLLKSEGL